jgi:hypothetical protein
MAEPRTFYAVRRRLMYRDWRGADEWRIFRGLRLYPWSKELLPECLTADPLEAMKAQEATRDAEIVEFRLQEANAKPK